MYNKEPSLHHPSHDGIAVANSPMNNRWPAAKPVHMGPNVLVFGHRCHLQQQQATYNKA